MSNHAVLVDGQTYISARLPQTYFECKAEYHVMQSDCLSGILSKDKSS